MITYYQSTTPNAAIINRGSLETQIEDYIRNFNFLTRLIDESEELTKEQKIKHKIYVAQMFLGGSYEFIASFLGRSGIERLRISNPKFNFLHHCRNAVFHENKFDFTNRGKWEIDPKRIGKARWKNRTIKKDDQGKQLFTEKLKIEETVDLIQDTVKLF